MKISLISPRLSIQKKDFLGSGIPYWPIELITFATFLEKKNKIKLIDLFGNNPKKISKIDDDYYAQGENISQHYENLKNSDLFIIFAISYMSHNEILYISNYLKKNFSNIKIIILENSQAVTAYSLDAVSDDFFKNGADYLLCGEPYFNWDDVSNMIFNNSQIPRNILKKNHNKSVMRIYKKNYEYPIPNWGLLNLENYWNLPYSHGPKIKKKFLPILTSRGCPYPCDFCVIPKTNDRLWRFNHVDNVVNEISYLQKKYDVHYFQVEDLNPTIKNKRWSEISKLLILNKVDIKFSFVSGTKAETVDIKQLSLLYKSGLRYLSISPESGSRNVMQKIGKKFDYEYALKLIKNCNKEKIYTQACFVIGHPDEKEEDFLKTKKYLIELIKSGLNEAAFFIVSPFAGSKLFYDDRMNLNRKKIVSFSPIHRKEYFIYNRRRNILILNFIIYKFIFQFRDTFKMFFRSILGKPRTKIENIPRRIYFVIKYIILDKLKH